MEAHPLKTSDGRHMIEFPEEKEYEENRWNIAKILRQFTIGVLWNVEVRWLNSRTARYNIPAQHIMLDWEEETEEVESFFDETYTELVANRGHSMCGHRFYNVILTSYDNDEEAFEGICVPCANCLRKLKVQFPKDAKLLDYWISLSKAPQSTKSAKGSGAP